MIRNGINRIKKILANYVAQAMKWERIFKMTAVQSKKYLELICIEYSYLIKITT